MKHTQGEWKVVHNKETSPFEVAVFSKQNGNKIMSLQSDEYGYGNDEEVLANAKLIATAPELLELIQWISRATNNPQIGIKCDAAIKKATV